MVNVTAPLHSIDASGKLAKVLQFDRRRRGVVAGRRRRPRQPFSDAQRATRVVVPFLSNQWKSLTDAEKATWQNHAKADTTSPYHAYLHYNLNRLKNLPGATTRPDLVHLYPSACYPWEDTGVTCSSPTHTYTGGKFIITHEFDVTWLAQSWIWIWHHITTGEPNPVYHNIVHMALVDHVGDYVEVIRNLAPGSTTIRYTRHTRTGKTNKWYRSFTRTVTA